MRAKQVIDGDTIYFETKQARSLYGILEMLRPFCKRFNFQFREDEIIIHVMNCSNSVMITVRFGRDEIEKSGVYHFPPAYRTQGTILAGVHTDVLQSITKLMGADDSIAFTIDPKKNPNIIRVSLLQSRIQQEAEGKVSVDNCVSSVYDLRQLNMESGTPPKIQLPEDATVVEVESQAIKGLFKALSPVNAETLLITRKEGTSPYLNFTGANDMYGRVDHIIEQTVPLGSKRKRTYEAIHNRFPLKLFKHASKASPLTDVVELTVANNYPIKLRYRVTNMGLVTVYISTEVDPDQDIDIVTPLPPEGGGTLLSFSDDEEEMPALKKGKLNCEEEEKEKESCL